MEHKKMAAEIENLKSKISLMWKQSDHALQGNFDAMLFRSALINIKKIAEAK